MLPPSTTTVMALRRRSLPNSLASRPPAPSCAMARRSSASGAIGAQHGCILRRGHRPSVARLGCNGARWQHCRRRWLSSGRGAPACKEGGNQHARREAVSMHAEKQSACNQHAISMQSACNQHAISCGRNAPLALAQARSRAACSRNARLASSRLCSCFATSHSSTRAAFFGSLGSS